MTRFLHSSDWQLGMTRHFLSPEAQARFTQDRIDAIRRIGEIAAGTSARFVVVAGDVFESNQVAPQTVVRALDALGSIPVPVFLLPANHDPLDSASVYRSASFRNKKPGNVVVVESSDPLPVPGADGVEVIGLPWHGKRQLVDRVAAAVEGLQPAAPAAVRVLLGHGVVDELSPDPDAPDVISLEVAEKAIRDGRIQYLALGDRHSATNVGSTGAIWYSGTHVVTDFRDTNPGKVLLVEVSGDRRVEVQERDVDEASPWRFVDRTFELHEPADVDAVHAALAGQADKARTVLRLALTGQLGVAAKAKLDATVEEFEQHFASLREWERHTDLVVVPDEMDESALELGGYAREAWAELAAAARGQGDDAAKAADALSLFYRLALLTRGAGGSGEEAAS